MKTTQSRFFKSCETFLMRIYKQNPQKFKAISPLLLKFLRKRSEQNPLDVLHKLVNIISDNTTYITDLNKLLHSELQVPLHKNDSTCLPSNEEYKEQLQKCLALIAEKSMEKFKQIRDRLSKEKNNIDNNPIQLLNFIKEFFPEDHEIYEQVKTVLSDWKKKFSQPEMPLQETLQNENIEGFPRQKIPKKTLPRAQNPYQRPQPIYSRPSIIRNPFQQTNLTTTNKAEYSFFDCTMRNSFNEAVYADILKCLYLYSNSIISSTELFEITKESFNLTDTQVNNILQIFKNIVLSRENSRRKASGFFKPLCELDFSKCERNKQSYTRLPENYPKMKNTGADVIALDNLNKVWVSVPQGSEHYSFNLMRKNQYEEALFKCEDEKFEFDITINIFKRGIKLLNQIKDPKISFEEKISIMQDLRKLKVLENLYENHLSHFIDLFNCGQNSEKIIDQMLEKFETKLSELQEIKSSAAKKNWSEIAEKNFHRSLDHRSFYFKKQEKKYTAQNRFLNEAEFRYNTFLNKISDLKENEFIEKDPKQFYQVLNTFEGITSGIKCEHQDIQQDNFENQENIFCPIFKFLFSNQKVQEDTLSFLYFYINHFHLTHNEKEKVKKFIKNVFTGLLHSEIKILDFCENRMSEQKLLPVVMHIEQAIFDKTFSFFSNQATENVEVKEDPKENVGEISKEFFEKNDEIIENKKDSDAEILNSSNESHEGEKENLKEMNFLDEETTQNTMPFLPKNTNDSLVFYGTKALYSFLRFYFTLYERILKAYEESNYFENNKNSKLLTEKEKTLLAEERYSAFKIILLNLIKQKIDSTKYEDFLRSIFGNNAFLFFTIDKVLSLTTKAAQISSNDELSHKILNQIMAFSSKKSNKFFNEQIFLSKLNETIFNLIVNPSDRNLFRFYFNFNSKVLFVYFLELQSKNWEKENFNNMNEYFFQSLSVPVTLNKKKQSFLPVFLKKNKDKILKKLGKKYPDCFQQNNIIFKTNQNSSKIIAENSGKEDTMFSFSNRKRHACELFSISMNKSKKVKAWIDKNKN